MSWSGVITNAGQSMLDQWTLGGHVLTITGATVGSGYVSAASMRAATALNSEEDDASIISSEAITDGTRFKIQVGPTDGTAYTAHEIGLWAKLDDGEETLLALHQDPDGGVGVPTSTDSPDFAFAMYLVHSISNSSDLSVNVDTSAYVSQSTFAAEAAKQDGRHLRYADTTTPDMSQYDADNDETFVATFKNLFRQFVFEKGDAMMQVVENYDTCVVEFVTRFEDRFAGTCAIKTYSAAGATIGSVDVIWSLATVSTGKYIAFHGVYTAMFNKSSHTLVTENLRYKRLVETDERTGSLVNLLSGCTIVSSSVRRSGKVCSVYAEISLSSAWPGLYEFEPARISGIGSSAAINGAHGVFIGYPSKVAGLVEVDNGNIKIIHRSSSDTTYHVILQFLAND